MINFCFTSNPTALKLDFLIGYNNDSHDNLVWNFVNGWFAYTVENLVVMEELGKARKQKIIPFTENISVLTLSKDWRYLLIGAATRNEKDIANIYVLDSKTSKIVKTLGFHSRGV